MYITSCTNAVLHGMQHQRPDVIYTCQGGLRVLQSTISSTGRDQGELLVMTNNSILLKIV